MSDEVKIRMAHWRKIEAVDPLGFSALPMEMRDLVLTVLQEFKRLNGGTLGETAVGVWHHPQCERAKDRGISCNCDPIVTCDAKGKGMAMFETFSMYEDETQPKVVLTDDGGMVQ